MFSDLIVIVYIKLLFMKILLLSTFDFNGAGKATYKIFNALRNEGVDCEHRVLIADKDKRLSNKISKFSYMFKNKLESLVYRFENKKINEYKSLSLFPTFKFTEINKSDFDIIHLTWINNFINIEDIGKITKPIVWSLCDMWPISGANHYDDYSENAFWREKNFSSFNFPNLSIDKWIIERKINAWKNKINYVAPSEWLYECVRASKVTSASPVHKIPWPINRNIFRRMDKIQMRKKFGLPLNKKLILFNSFSGVYNSRKGWDIFLEAIKLTKNDFDIMVIGSSNTGNFKKYLNKSIYWMGKFNDDNKIAELINCADIFLLPSRLDNLPQSGLEAQSCGLPVVAFNANGLSDLIDHKINGYLSDPFDASSLANGIDWVCKDLKNLSKNSITKAIHNWDSRLVANKYKKLYKSLLVKK